METRRKEGEKLTEEELAIIEERPVNLKLNEALEEMYLRRSSEVSFLAYPLKLRLENSK